jgi:putative ABC transport system permease protein
VAALAAASAPIHTEASANAVFAERLTAVPATAAQSEAPVVRVSTTASPRSADQQDAVRDLRSVPHLTAPRLGGGSVGAELAGPAPWASTVTAGGPAAPTRLFAVDDPRAALVPTATAPGDGAWLPQPLADELGAKPGATVTYTVRSAGRVRTADVRVAGVYATSGRLPTDPPGGRSWASQRTSLPADPTAKTLSAFLLVADVATIERLAAATDDRILWWADADLAPGTTLAGARETARALDRLRVRIAQQESAATTVVTPRVISGIGRVADEAAEVADGVESRMRTVEWAAIAIGLLSVLAVGLLSVRRRVVELRHDVGTGVTPTAVGGLWFLEHLGPGLAAGAAGWAAAWALLARWGPPGDVTSASLGTAGAAAAGVAVVGSLAAAGVAAATAARRVRPAPPAVPVRPRPWGLLVVVAAAVAGAGLWGSTRAGGIDRAVPLLVLAAAGVLTGMLLVRLAGVRRRRPASARVTASRRVVPWLVRRRVAAGGERVLTVMVLSAGLGMLAFALCALDSVAVVTADRVAVQSGASAVAQIPGSWALDPDPPELTPEELPDGEGPVPGLRTPPLPPHATFVWRIDADTTLDYGARDLMAIDPARFLEVASWGRGADLAAARRAVGRLATVGAAAAAPGRPLPAIVVGDPAVAGVDDVPVDLGPWKGRLDVVAHLPAFPGLGDRPLFVVPDAAVFSHLGRFDPRLRSSGDAVGGMLVRTYLWSSAGAAGIGEVLSGPGVQPERLTTAAQARQRPSIIAADRTRGYQVAVAVYLALLAVVALCVFSERTASAGRAADLMLARVGVGRRRVVLARAVELAVLVAAALAGAAAGLAVLAPLAARLLDEDPTMVPALRFTVPPSAVLAPLAVAVAATGAATALALLRARTREEEAYRAGD